MMHYIAEIIIMKNHNRVCTDALSTYRKKTSVASFLFFSFATRVPTAPHRLSMHLIDSTVSLALFSIKLHSLVRLQRRLSPLLSTISRRNLQMRFYCKCTITFTHSTASHIFNASHQKEIYSSSSKV